MSHILVLIADPAHAALDDRIVSRARAAVSGGDPLWLAPGIASEMAVAGSPAERLAAARQALADAPIDAAIMPQVGRRKKLLVADMESTLIENEFLDDIAARAGIGARVADITRRAMAGELDFAGALRERVAMLKDLDALILEETYAGLKIMPGAKTLVATMRAHGALTAIVSGGFRIFVERVREALGADHAEANHLEVDGWRLRGTVSEPIFDRAGKQATLERLAAQRGLALAETMAVGDGANDLDMIKAAGLGVAFRAKPIRAAAAAASIRHGDLTALLYLQGYRQSDFAA
jgi:phosphoserine phosphatase